MEVQQEATTPAAATHCDGCGQPAHQTAHGDILPLKRCSRCQQAFYHDVDCQKKHYLQHKEACRRRVKQQQRAQGPSKTHIPAGSPFWGIRQRPGRGNCVVATRPLPINHFITANSMTNVRDNNNESTLRINNSLAPLVLPVLNRTCRTERCAYCFSPLASPPFHSKGTTATTIPLYQHPICPILVCSPACRRHATAVLHPEISCIESLYGDNNNNDKPGPTITSNCRPPPPTLLPTALLIFRILLHDSKKSTSSSILAATKTMQTHPTAPLCENAKTHLQAVIYTVQGLANALPPSSKHNELSADLASICHLWNVIRYNAFTIVDCHHHDDVVDDIPLGVALYPAPAHVLNHSCRPNAVQLFLHMGPKQHHDRDDDSDQPQPPRLGIRVTQPVAAGEEVCIPYVPGDEQQSREQRRLALWNEYNFWCDCELCQEQKGEELA